MNPSENCRSARLQSYCDRLRNQPKLYRPLIDVLDAGGTPDPDEALYLHVWAPVLTEFVEWVLERASSDGIRRLYFLARDAWPMYLAASKICAGRGFDIDCRYLKLSRYALRLPQFHLQGEACVEYICTGGIRVTLEKILRRASLDDGEIKEVARQIGCEGRLQNELPYPVIMALKPVLAGNAFFMECVMRRSREAYPAAIGYLEQEGLLDGTPYALVDSGWIGTMQQTTERLLRTRKPDICLNGYYFGLYELPDEANPARYHPWLFGPRRGLRRKVRFSNCLFETVCSAPDGMTLGYLENAGRFVPVESESRNPNAERLERYGALLERYVEAYCAYEYTAQSEDAAVGNLLTLMGAPQKWEVDALGDNLFCDDVLENTLQPAAAHLTDEEIRDQRLLRKALILLGVRKRELHESAWIEGSIVRNGRRTHSYLVHARLYKNLVYLRKLGKSL